MDKKETVCAVVTTYNRKKLLIECLESLRIQTRPLDAIYIIDNASTDNTPQLLKEKGYIENLPPKDLQEPWEDEFQISNLTDGDFIKIHYVRMHKNTGGAGGFYEGVKRAYEKGYDWLWLMDDDAEPDKHALKMLEEFRRKKGKNLKALACKVVYPSLNICFNHRGIADLKNIYPMIQKPLSLDDYQKEYTEIDIASFVGLLINRKIISKIGFPRKEFFIHHDDVEYCLRLRNFEKIFLVNSSVIIHKEEGKKGTEKSFFGKKVKRVPFDKLWLAYFSPRNLTWLGQKYGTNKFAYYRGLIKMILGSIKDILLYDDRKILRIKFLIHSYIDGLKGNFDNDKPQKLLYKK